MLAANLPSLIISKAPRWVFYQKHAGYYQQISQKCFKIQPLLHPRPPNSNSCMHLHHSHTAKLKDHRLGQKGWFSKPRALCPQQGLTGGALAALQLKHPLQNLMLLRKIPSHSSINVSLGVARLHSCQPSPSGWHVPSGDPCSHTGVARMNGSDLCHMFGWLVIAGGASTEAYRQEFLRWVCRASHEGAVLQGVLPGTAVLVRLLSFDPFPMLIPKGANRNKLPLRPHSLSAHSPQVHWVDAFGWLKPLLS